MSVLDRAIVKAFERRDRSAIPEKQALAEARSTAPVFAHEAPRQRVAVVEVPATPPSLAVSVQSQDSPNPDGIQGPATPVASRLAELGAHETVAEAPASIHVRHQPLTEASSSTTLPNGVRTVETPAPPVVVSPPPIVPTSVHIPAPVLPAFATQPVAQNWIWPEICEQLDQFTGEGFRQLAKHLQFAAEQGHKVLAFVSSQRDVGRTSVLLTLTRILALEGKSSALLIDADHRHPQIATLTGLQPKVGFEEVLKGAARMQQATTPMTPGQITQLPLTETVSDRDWSTLATALRMLLQKARRDYDMVLMDAGVFGAETKLPECWLRGAADAVITVSRQLTAHSAEHVVLDWKQIGIESLGVIETFA